MMKPMVFVAFSALITVTVAHGQTAGPPSWSVGDTWKLSDGRELKVVRVDENGYARSGDIRDCPTCLVHFSKDLLFTGNVSRMGNQWT